MLSWSLAQCGLTRSRGVSQDCFISAAVLKWQTDPGSRAGPGFRPEVSWRIWQTAPQMLMHFPYREHFPQFTHFIISSLPRWLSLICLCLWSNSHWESLKVSIMTTFAGHAEFFCCRFLSIWCPHSSLALIDYTYPGLFTVTVPNAHTSSGMLGFYVSKRRLLSFVSVHIYTS